MKFSLPCLIQGKDLPRIRSEGGMVPKKTGVMIAG